MLSGFKSLECALQYVGASYRPCCDTSEILGDPVLLLCRVLTLKLALRHCEQCLRH